MRSDVNDGILFYTPFTHEKNACISTSGSMIYHLFICCTVSEQNPHVITAGIENTVNINFASVSTVKANVIVTYNKTIITQEKCFGKNVKEDERALSMPFK